MSEIVENVSAALAAADITGEDAEPKGPSKAELKKLAKKAEKEAKKAEHKAKEAAAASANKSEAGASASSADSASAAAAADEMAHLYGDSPLICSRVMSSKSYKNIKDLNERHAGTQIWLRARVHTSRTVSKGVFLLLRQTMHSIQGIVWQGPNVPKPMVKYASSVSLESVVDILADVVMADVEVQSATVKNIELKVREMHVVSRAMDLPFIVDDAGRNEAEAAAAGLPIVSQDTALNYRWIDTRTPANQAIFRIQSAVCQLFRSFLLKQDFVEIHTPKLIAGASEGGSNVFKLSYFDQAACLAQSPQLYKQMTAACGGFERVFEIGPVFRAENSNTHRHLCEFTGLDFEMAIYEHYYEALDVMGALFIHIFDGLNDGYRHELQLISQQYPYEPLVYSRPSLRITFKEGIDLLRESGIMLSYEDDLSTPHEKALGKLVKEKYNTDFYIMDKYPLGIRPFYTMPDPDDATVSNSYDLFIRGEEIVSGAQRIHDPELLLERAKWWNIPLETIQSYVDAFRHGALPHAGGGIGMERVVMLFLGLKNIRKTSMFPRDPSRLAP